MSLGIIDKYKNESSFLRKFSIKQRLLFAFLITSLLPVMFVAMYSNVRYEESISDKISNFSLQLVSETAINTERELAQYETLSESMIINEYIQRGLLNYKSMTDFEKNKLQTTINDELSQQVFRLSNISNVVILTNDGTPFYDLGYEWYPDNQIAESLEGVDDSSGNMKWTHLKSNRNSDKIALSRVIYSAENLNEKLGYLVIVIDEKVFSRNTYEHVNLGTGGTLFMVDRNGIVVSSLSPSIPQGQVYKEQETVNKTEYSDDSSYYAIVDNKKMLVVKAYIRSSDWNLIGLIPHSYMISELSAIRGNLLYICLLIVLLAGFLALWIYQSISSPMRGLLQYAQQVKRGRLETRMTFSYPDEMGKLSKTIDQMVMQLKLLITQVKEEQLAKRDAELKMLQAQINPHFLFNTLNSLKWSAMMSGNKVIEQGIASLSELLRNTILVNEEMIPLEVELKNLLHYAVIQRIRYGDSFKLNCSMSDDQLYQCLVPKFILQPIVENSIIHAGGGDGRRVGILVEGSRSEEGLQIRIADDGKGFDMNEVRFRKHSHDKLSGIGIENVNERIRLHVGSEYGVSTNSKPSKGTETIIKLPIIVTEDHKDV